MNRLKVINNPLCEELLSILRNKNTDSKRFREISDKISNILLIETSTFLDRKKIKINTPLIEFDSYSINEEIVFISILRAGIPMIGKAAEIFTDIKFGIAGLKRDENTAVASEYYWNVPEINSNKTVIIGDPMLATGGSVLHVIKKINNYNPKKIIIASIISSQAGIENVLNFDEKINIVACTVDPELNSKKYIVPGLGDFGDRYFGTTPDE